ncbi:hypothetical protein DY000_02031244 [Brassica cretica]|uniref:Aminotransferase-like plant mobile domain-containing protein n=1 Tax=Brassica cretica TaxID=69181 RepID=A0ABQ7DR39_BRACR|nr:hypothetical protein DY000_02031244 [Brassica cretica]
MFPRIKASTKSRHDRSVPDGSSLQHDDVVPKVEFAEHSVDPAEVEAYWEAKGEVNPPRPGTWVPSLFHSDPVDGCHSKSQNGLAAIRSFCRIPKAVEFHLPEAGEVAEFPLDSYFTYFEAYLMQCHLWFPLPEAVVRLFGHFWLSIGQVNPCGLQHLVGILVLSYEWGMTLDVDHLEGLFMSRGNSDIVQLLPRNNMAIVKGLASNFHSWKKNFIFVCVNNASVEESCIPMFRTRWGRKVMNPLPSTLDDLLTVRDLLYGGPFKWASFTPKRVRRAVALHRSRLQPDLPVEEGAESSMDMFVPVERVRSRTRKDKYVIVDDDVAVGQGSPTDNILRDYLNIQAGGSGGDRIDLNELLDFDFPPTEGGSGKVPEFTKASRMVNGGLLMMNRALKVSSQEAGKAQFRAEMADMEIARLKDELKCSRRHERGSAATKICRAYRRGKREMAEVMKSRRDSFSCEFRELKESYQALGDYRECRGTVGGLFLTRAFDYSFSVEDARQTRRMNERDRDFTISQIEERISKQREPIHVSPDTTVFSACCRTGPKESQNQVFFRGFGLILAEKRPCRERLLNLLERCGVSINRGNVSCWSIFNVVIGSGAVTSLLVVEIVS